MQMNRFGFEIQADNTIDYDLNNRSIAEFVLEQEPSLYNCIQCGSCTASCPASDAGTYQFRRMHLHMRRGEIKNLAEEVSQCMLCGKCILVCPRGVNTRNVIRQIRIALNIN